MDLVQVAYVFLYLEEDLLRVVLDLLHCLDLFHEVQLLLHQLVRVLVEFLLVLVQLSVPLFVQHLQRLTAEVIKELIVL